MSTAAIQQAASFLSLPTVEGSIGSMYAGPNGEATIGVGYALVFQQGGTWVERPLSQISADLTAAGLAGFGP